MLVYLDSSAVVKLCRTEDQTDALLDHLISYDKRMVSAAEAADLPVAMPG